MQSVLRTFEILEYLAHNAEAGITELSNELGQSKSAIYRFLSSLKSLGYVKQDSGNDKYRLTLKLFEISSKAIEQDDTIASSRPVLEKLASESGESVHLSVLERDSVVYIDKVDSAHNLRLFSHIGRSAPAHCTAMGKALLASRPEEYIDELYSSQELRAYTQNTIVDINKLKRSLAVIRKNGVAVDNEEYEPGVKCVGAPIYDYSGEAIAAFAIAGPSIRLPQTKIRHLKEKILRASQEISRRLGYNS
jgi:IclR family KDG regulon transcriptional repressor